METKEVLKVIEDYTGEKLKIFKYDKVSEELRKVVDENVKNLLKAILFACEQSAIEDLQKQTLQRFIPNDEDKNKGVC